MLRLLFKRRFDTPVIDYGMNGTHNILGGIVYIPGSDELYFTKEHKQAFNFLGIKLWATSEIRTFQVPVNMISMLSDISMMFPDEVVHFDVNTYRQSALAAIKVLQDNVIASKDKMDPAMYDHMLSSIFTTFKSFNDLSDEDSMMVAPFTLSGYTHIMTTDQGSSKRILMVKPMHCSIDVFAVTLTTINKKPVLVDSEHMLLTKDFITDALTHLGVDIAQVAAIKEETNNDQNA